MEQGIGNKNVCLQKNETKSDMDSIYGKISENNSNFRHYFASLVLSPIYVAFAICLTASRLMTSVAAYDVLSTVIPVIRISLETGITSPEILLPAGFVGLLLVIILISGIVDTIGIWINYCDAKKCIATKSIGLRILLYLHWCLLGLATMGFLVTLPLFVKYTEIPNEILQVVYVLYALLIAYFSVSIEVLSNVVNNLLFWEKVKGSIVILSVLFILAAIVVLLAIAVGMLDKLHIITTTYLVLLSVLLLKYKRITRSI